MRVQLKTEQTVYAALGFLFLILLGMGVFADRSVARLVDDSESVVQTVEVNKSLEELSSLLTQLQINPRRSLPNSIRETAADIRRFTADNQRQQGRLDVLEPLITAMIDNPSRGQMDEIRRNIGVLREEEDRLLTLRHAQSQKTAAQTTNVVRAGAAIGLMALFAFALVIRRGVRRRRQIREELERFFDLSVDLFCIRTYEGQFKRLNSAWERTLGYTRDDLFEKPFTAFIHPDDIQPTLAKVRELINGKNTLHFDNRYRTKNGGYRWLRWTATCVPEEQLIYSAARDITDRREAEVARARHAETVALVSQTMDVLQSCETEVDACRVIDRMTPQLFKGFSGGVYQLAASRNVLERIAAWGTLAPSENFIAPADCLALKRGRGALTKQDSPLHCVHTNESRTAYICIPMVALNDTIGMLHLRQESDDAPIEEQHLPFATNMAEQFALTLANLRLKETLRAQSIRDPLTGLFNRRYLEESLEREIHRASRNGTPLSVLMLDLDHFKRFNDTFGHDAGDAVLREWGGFLQVRVRFEDIVCRLGGEEFAIVLPDAKQEAADEVAQRICQDARTLTVSHRNNQLGPITVSIGVAFFPTHGANAEMLLQRADQALYQAKGAGRNQVVLATAQPV
jgi:diguanylate cyclase (GGDEF)-like protein/PAS domain S-box-containing protein